MRAVWFGQTDQAITLEGCTPEELTDALIDLWREGGKEIEGLLGRVAERLKRKE